MSVRCSHLLIKHEGSRNPVSRRTNEVSAERIGVARGSRLGNFFFFSNLLLPTARQSRRLVQSKVPSDTTLF